MSDASHKDLGLGRGGVKLFLHRRTKSDQANFTALIMSQWQPHSDSIRPQRAAGQLSLENVATGLVHCDPSDAGGLRPSFLMELRQYVRARQIYARQPGQARTKKTKPHFGGSVDVNNRYFRLKLKWWEV